MIEIKETTINDIDNIQRLWANGDVMRFVGFPDGLHKTSEETHDWFRQLESNRSVMNHYSIFEDGKYCGESFYKIDVEYKSTALDTKLFDFARGRGIAMSGLSYAIKEAFSSGAKAVWVNPNPENIKAIILYERLALNKRIFQRT